MSVGQYQSSNHLGFLHNEHNRQQDELNRNILDRLHTLEQYKMKSFSSSQKNTENSGGNEQLRNSLREISNVNVENLRKLEQSNRQNWKQLYDKMRNMESKMLRMLRDKQEAMEYLELRISSNQNSQKTVGDLMRKIMEQDSQKYAGVTLLEQRLKQIQHRFQLKDQKQGDNLKILKQEIEAQVHSKISKMEQTFQQNIKQAISSTNLQSNLQKNRKNQAEDLAESVRMVQMEIKENRRKVLALEDRFGSLETDTEQIERKFQNIQKDLQNMKSNFNTQPKSYRESDIRIQEPVSRADSSERKNFGSRATEKKREQLPRSQFRGISQIGRREDNQQSEPSEQENPLEQMNSMRGGIRGLLQKSKEKQQKLSHRELPQPKGTLTDLGSHKSLNQPKGLPRQQSLAPANPLARGLQRGLPPVKTDQKLMNQKHIKDPSESEQEQQEQQVYGVDQQGYLLNEEGEYIENEYGQRVQLSQQDFMELMKQQNN